MNNPIFCKSVKNQCPNIEYLSFYGTDLDRFYLSGIAMGDDVDGTNREQLERANKILGLFALRDRFTLDSLDEFFSCYCPILYYYELPYSRFLYYVHLDFNKYMYYEMERLMKELVKILGNDNGLLVYVADLGLTNLRIQGKSFEIKKESSIEDLSKTLGDMLFSFSLLPIPLLFQNCLNIAMTTRKRILDMADNYEIEVNL